MSVLQIDDNDIMDPQTMTWDLYDLDTEDGAGRNQEGLMFRDCVALKRKLSCTWGPLEPEQMAELLQAMPRAERQRSPIIPKAQSTPIILLELPVAPLPYTVGSTPTPLNKEDLLANCSPSSQLSPSP